jgi:HK97 family phage major capsid protein
MEEYDSTKMAIRKELDAAAAITDRVVEERRGLTADEKVKCLDHLAAAKKLEDRARDGAELQRQIGELGNIVGAHPLKGYEYPPGEGYESYSPSHKAGPGAAWGTAIVKSGHFKQGGGGGGDSGLLTPSGAVLVTVPPPEPVVLGQPVAMLRSVIPAERNAGQIRYLRQTVRDNQAAVVAPFARKPTSNYQLEPVEDKTRTIAHLSSPIHRNDLADSSALQAFVQSEMYYGIERALESEIITGDGTGEHLPGLANTSGVLAVPYATNLVTTTRKAVTALENEGLTGTAWVLNPADWEAVELSATTTGSLLMAEAGQATPVQSSARRLWGIPVVATPACPDGAGWLADFGSTRLFVTEEVSLTWFEGVYDANAFGTGDGASDFERNLIRFRVEGRFGFGVTRPSGVVHVDLSA